MSLGLPGQWNTTLDKDLREPEPTLDEALRDRDLFDLYVGPFIEEPERLRPVGAKEVHP